MTALNVTYAMPDTYFQLVKQFPLVHIRDKGHLEAAFEVIDRLLRTDLDEGGQEYLLTLTDLVGIYEEEHVMIPDVSVADVLRELMCINECSQNWLAKELKISLSTISAVLHGTRSLTKNQMVRLARFFDVPMALFLPDPSCAMLRAGQVESRETHQGPQ